MARQRALLLFSVLMILALSATGLAQRADIGSDTFLLGVATTTQTLVYAPFVANIEPAAPAGDAAPGLRFDTTMIVSNPLGFPNGLTSAFLVGGADTTGTVELTCRNFDGTLIFFESSMDATVGSGLADDGTLTSGESWIFLFREVLGAVTGDPDTFFSGNCWVLGNFDGIAGVGSVLGFGVGFTQTTTMTPAVGEGPTPMMGIPVTVP